MKKIAASLASLCALVLLAPWLALNRIAWLPGYSRYLATAKWLAIIPGFVGIQLRRTWYAHTLAACGRQLTVDWMGVIRDQRSEIGERVTIGAFSWVSYARIGDDVMVGDHVALLSGGRQHASDRTDVPMRDQPGTKVMVQVGADVWIGSHAVVMADVSTGTIVGAGAVVTRTFPARGVLMGVPARLARTRGAPG